MTRFLCWLFAGLMVGACVPLSLVTDNLAVMSRHARIEGAAGSRSRASATRCSESALAGVREARAATNFPGYLRPGRAKSITDLVAKECEHEPVDGGVAVRVQDLGVVEEDRRDGAGAGDGGGAADLGGHRG